MKCSLIMRGFPVNAMYLSREENEGTRDEVSLPNPVKKETFKQIIAGKATRKAGIAFHFFFTSKTREFKKSYDLKNKKQLYE